MKRLAVVVCAAMLLAGCASLDAEKSAKMAEYMELCEVNGGKASYHNESGTVICKWNLNKEES